MPYSSKAANYILYTPLDTKAIVENDISDRLKEDEFFSHCYVEPQHKTNFNSFVTDSYFEPYDYVVKSEHINDLRKKQESDFENFKKWLNNETNHKVYTISGNAGTGKSTFINKLKIDHPEMTWTILDVIKANDVINWFGDIRTDIVDFSTPYSKMIAITLTSISKILFKEQKEDEIPNHRAIKKDLKQILDFYNKNLKKFKYRGYSLLDDLTRILLVPNTTQKNLIKCAIHVKNYFEESFETIRRNNNSQKIMLRSALDVLFLLLYCLNPTKKHIIIFDNLERFICHDEIYNKDLDDIRKELASYSQNLYQSRKAYSSKFKIIMGIRTSSVRMCGVKLDAADENPSDLNLTDWFLAEKIISKKHDWYVNNGYERFVNNTNCLSKIISDLRMCSEKELTGLQLFITPLFNDNIRLMVDFIGMIVEQESNKSLITKYTELWEENTHVSRFAARTIIRGMVYEALDNNDNLFKNLLLQPTIPSNDENANIYGLSYARKILTVLYNREDEDVPLAEVLSIISKTGTKFDTYWKDKVSKNTKNDIAKILFYMNSYNRRDNDWIQFVDMQISGIKQSTSITNEEQLCQIISDNINSVYLKIMPAGQTYLRYIVSSFEYFSYRFYKKYTENYSPLFACVPTLSELNNSKNVKDLLCYKIVDYVSFNAIGCMENIKTVGDIEIHLSKDNTKTHIERIANHHRGYIDKFIYYIQRKYGKNDKCDELIKELKILKKRYANFI